MLICKNVLSESDLDRLNLTEWTEGKSTLGSTHKKNSEIHNHEKADFIKQRILEHNNVRDYGFLKYMTTPRFNKYENGGKYNKHVDFFRQEGIRTDWSMTLFLSDPNTYEGGELVIEDKQIKLDAGDMVLYPSGRVHQVLPVTQGKRIAAIAWAESFVASYENRQLLMKLVDLSKKYPDEVDISCVYNNLLRKWS